MRHETRPPAKPVPATAPAGNHRCEALHGGEYWDELCLVRPECQELLLMVHAAEQVNQIRRVSEVLTPSSVVRPQHVRHDVVHFTVATTLMLLDCG